MNWIEISCDCCNGLTWNDGNECPDCFGTGRLFVTPNDRIIAYPAGPLRGYAPGLYAKELAKQQDK